MGDSTTTSSQPFIDPIHFSIFLLCCLFLFVFYLLLPRGFRVHHFRAYPKRYAWSARSRAARTRRSHTASTSNSSNNSGMHNSHGSNANSQNKAGGHLSLPVVGYPGTNLANDETVTFDNNNPPIRSTYSEPNDEIVISAAMQQLREYGVLIVAHGSRGRPKTVRLQLTESAITWRTETRKKSAPGQEKLPPKLGKLHQVPLAHIMYVDVGKQTTALRRVENAGVPETLCFSLLTKEGSLDLEANSPRERDALVGCFSLVLDEVHAAQNWRDIYRGPSSDMPSSFDDFENEDHAQAVQQIVAEHGGI